jgi:adenine deaminase
MGNIDLEFRGNIIDVVKKKIFKGVVIVSNGRIKEVKEEQNNETCCILPGLIDSHIHIESSMLAPSEFARLAVVHGTVATVSDPHEIANVLGIKGVRFMIENGKQVPFKFYFGASPCVPATGFETAGGILGPEDLEELLKSEDIHYCSEMMNFPGVLYGDPEVAKKLALAKKYHKPIDGHAPGLRGEQAKKYIAAGISTDHECYTLEEAEEKISYGMKILIREGSAAKNFEALSPLIDKFPDEVMLCSDDKHPNELVEGHINQLIKRAFSLGYDKMNVLRSATYNPVKHYGLNTGLLQSGDPADFIIVDNLEKFTILSTYVNGIKVSENGQSQISSVQITPVNKFHAKPIKLEDIIVKAEGKMMRVIDAVDGQLVTGESFVEAISNDDKVNADPEHDILKIVVVNRYFPAPCAVGFIQGFGLKSGAIASSVAHDSHNIIAVGVDDESLVSAINAVVKMQGGIAVAFSNGTVDLPLQVAGIVSVDDGYSVAKQYHNLDELVKTKLKSALQAPFMTLSFMALLVIPELKMSDKGLFNGKTFSFVSIFEK